MAFKLIFINIFWGLILTEGIATVSYMLNTVLNIVL